MRRDNQNNEQGVISIFFVIVVPILLVGTLSIYLHFMQIQEQQSIQKVVYATSETYLSKINSTLFKEFGLTATLDEGVLEQMVRSYLKKNGHIEQTDDVKLDLKFYKLNEPEHFKDIMINSAKVSVAREVVDFALGSLDRIEALNQVQKAMSKLTDLENELSQVMNQVQVHLTDITPEKINDARERIIYESEAVNRKYETLIREIEILKQAANNEGLISFQMIEDKKSEWQISKSEYDERVEISLIQLSQVESLDQTQVMIEAMNEKPALIDNIKRMLLELEQSFSGVKTGDGVLDFNQVEKISDQGYKIRAMSIVDKAMLNEYYLMIFSSYDKNCPRKATLNGRSSEKRTVVGEVEYLISGDPDEVLSIGNVKLRLLGLRGISNLISILSDRNKQMQLTQATVMLPYPWRMVAYSSLVALWCSAESNVDVNRLLKGEGIELIKMGDQWRLDLNRLLNEPLNQISNQLSTPEPTRDESKLYYQDYLRVLLLMQSESKTIVRAMDLINIEINIMSKGKLKLADFSIGHEIDLLIEPNNRFKVINGVLK